MDCDVESSTSKLTLTIDNKITRNNMTIIRIGTKSSFSYTKPNKQYNNQILPPFIKMRQLTHLFLNSILTDILDTINWSENERVPIPTIWKINSSGYGKVPCFALQR